MKSNPNSDYYYVSKVELKDNFTQIPNQIFKIKKLKTLDKLILIYLFSNSVKYMLTDYRISVELGTDRESTVKSINRLFDLEFITRLDDMLIININKIINYKTEEILGVDRGNPRNKITKVQRKSSVIQRKSSVLTEEILGVDRGNPTITIRTNTNIKEEPQQAKIENLILVKEEVKVNTPNNLNIDLAIKQQQDIIELSNSLRLDLNLNSNYLNNINRFNMYDLYANYFFKYDNPNKLDLKQFEEAFIIAIQDCYDNISTNNDLNHLIQTTILNHLVDEFDTIQSNYQWLFNNDFKQLHSRLSKLKLPQTINVN